MSKLFRLVLCIVVIFSVMACQVRGEGNFKVGLVTNATSIDDNRLIKALGKGYNGHVNNISWKPPISKEV